MKSKIPKGKYCYTIDPKLQCKYLLNGFVCEKYSTVNTVYGWLGVLENTTKCPKCLKLTGGKNGK